MFKRLLLVAVLPLTMAFGSWDCIICGRETGFLPKGDLELLSFPIYAGQTYELIADPAWGDLDLSLGGPIYKSSCLVPGGWGVYESCTFVAKSNGWLEVELYGVTQTNYEVRLEK